MRKSNIHHNMHKTQFQANVEIPLVGLIDKRLNITHEVWLSQHTYIANSWFQKANNIRNVKDKYMFVTK